MKVPSTGVRREEGIGVGGGCIGGGGAGDKPPRKDDLADRGGGGGGRACDAQGFGSREETGKFLCGFISQGGLGFVLTRSGGE